MRGAVRLHSRAAATTTAVLDRKGEDLKLANVADVLDFGAVFVERIVDGRHVATDPGVTDVAVADPDPRRVGVGVEADLWVERLIDGFEVLSQPSVVHAPDRRDVLL